MVSKFKHGSRSLLAVSSMLALFHAPLSLAEDDRFRVSADGGSVADAQLKVTWARCVVGMAFIAGTCSGKPGVFSFEDAQDYVKKQAGGRLPTEAERRSLERVTDDARSRPLFPNTPMRGIFDQDFDPVGAPPYIDKEGRLAYDYSVNERHLRLVLP